ncbi:MAG: HDOD domain-containing protein, partial [Deltaproteobacteria bacterium]|nr:HDOD domain-containing protein [Deltaproteobacteria bacterium]
MQQGKSFVEILNEQVLSDKTVLPTFDRTSMRIQEEIAKEDPDVTLIEELILHDQSLTSQVLRLANSAFYKGLVKVSTVRNAIIRLGIKEVANIVMLLTHQKNFYSKDPF